MARGAIPKFQSSLIVGGLMLAVGVTACGKSPAGGENGQTKAVVSSGADTAGAGDQDRFHQHVDPTPESIQANLMTPFCAPCHGGAHPKVNLKLDTFVLYADGGFHSARVGASPISPGEPSKSLLVQVIKETRPERRMPPVNNSLGIPAVAPDQVQALETWISSLPKPPDDGDVGP